MPEASPLWQGGMFLFAILFLAVEIWRGWRAGFARAGINFAAIIISTVVCLFAAQMAAAPFGGFKDPGGFVAAAVVGGGLGLFVFFVLWLTGIIFFKRTDHQSTGIFRFFWGSGGAFFGFLMGLLILWGGISVIRSLGALAEARVHIAQDAAAPAAPAVPGQPPDSAGPAPTPPPLAASLMKLKESLELGPAGKLVESVDVLPPDFYELIVQTGRLTGDPRALQRFFQYPGLENILSNPKFQALANDPAFQEAGQNVSVGTVTALMANPKLREAAQDPALAEQIKKIDLRAALKFALEKPTPSPSLSPGATNQPAAPARD
jgi:hypothetical protein